MLAAFMQIAVLLMAIYYGWHAVRGLQSGTVTFHPRYNAPRQLSRATNPAGFWTAVCAYLFFAAFVVASDIIRLILA